MKHDFHGFHLSKEVKEKLKNKKQLKKEFSDGKSAQQIMGLTDESMAEFYKAAHHLFEHKRYTDAANAFLYLVTLNSYNYEYWLGLGMATQMCRNFESAIDAYEMAAICELDNPVPYFYLAKCLFAIHDRENALNALDLAIEYSEEGDEFEDLRTQALAAKKILKKKL
jgi:type III secretion system low calcium response chaperone LcrH/SycD